jgi:hypothetical protein
MAGTGMAGTGRDRRRMAEKGYVECMMHSRDGTGICTSSAIPGLDMAEYCSALIALHSVIVQSATSPPMQSYASGCQILAHLYSAMDCYGLL